MTKELRALIIYRKGCFQRKDSRVVLGEQQMFGEHKFPFRDDTSASLSASKTLGEQHLLSAFAV
jgi:hypothetical protein